MMLNYIIIVTIFSNERALFIRESGSAALNDNVGKVIASSNALF
jgi:hypothetical protein